MTTAKYATYPSNWIGFEDLFESLSYSQKSNEASTFPPYNVIFIDDDNSIVELAIAGFGPEDLDVEWKDNTLTITGDKKEKDVRNYQTKGIATRKFTKCFRLGDHITPVGSYYENGMLGVELKRVIPESEKPKKLTIRSAERSFLQD